MKDNHTNKTQNLLALAKDGNESALNQLWKVYGARVHWIMRLRMGGELRSKLESMDLVQDALLSALEDLGNFTYKNDGDFIAGCPPLQETVMEYFGIEPPSDQSSAITDGWGSE